MPSDEPKIANDPAKVWLMLENIDVCMFVTIPDGVPHGRPMSTIPMQVEGKIYLLTDATSTAATDVASNATVLLSYQGKSDHVAVCGKASVSADKALVKRLWSPGAQVFWPDGPDASHVVAISVLPDRADYWDGPNPVVGAAKFLFGLVTRHEPDMGERGVVNL